MILALGAGVLDEVDVPQLHRMGENGSRHLDLVAEGKQADDVGGSIVDAGQPLRELCARLDLDIGRELLQHHVKQLDLRAGIAPRSGHEQIGHAVHDPHMFVDVTCLDRVDQFVDQRRIFCELQLFGGTIEVGHDDNNQ